MSISDIIFGILEQGGLATIAVLAIVYGWKKDKLATALQNRQVEKSEKYLEKYIALIRSMDRTLDALTDALGVEVEDVDTRLDEENLV